MKKILSILIFILALCSSMNNTFAQGVTSSSMSGTIIDETGAGLAGATIIAIHEPTGSRYATTTDANGRYRLPNVQVGGPYRVTASFVGYETREQTDLYLSLGQNYSLDLNMKEESVSLGGVEIYGTKDDILNSDRTGAATNVGQERIQALPTLTRSIDDYVRLTPQANTNLNASGGISLGGANNRFNNITIDGAVNNDVFGLSGTGQPGGQTGATSISLDAIQELQVNLAPYDVRQGNFTGGGINAVTRSGTNQLEGSVYAFMRNQYSVGVSPTTNTLGERTFANKFQDLQVGARLGGAIIKNKLFYFVNFEVGRRTEPIGFVPGDGNSLVSASNVATVYARALALGYDPGSGTEDFIRRNETNKFFIRFDWNISDKHKVTLRHNYNYGFQLDLARSTTNFNFANGAISFPSTTNSTVLEWRAILNNKFSNNLLLTYTSIRDDRNPVGSNFPRIAVQDGTTNIRLGPEEFSVQNRLDQDILSLTNNFDMYLGKHTLTIGTHIEFFQFANLFIRDNFGSYTYGSVADFVNNARPRNFNLSYGIRNGVPDATFVPEARFRAVQLGFYVQDDFEVNKKLRLTAGLRIDVPFILDNPAANLTYNNSAQAIASETRTDKVPASNILFSPRLGFNYDVLGDRTLQIRGGLGVFTGRIPFVWLSNQFGNTGTDVGRIGVTVPATGTGSTFRFAADPFNQYNNAIGSGLVPASTTEINVTDKNFQYPQVFRANLAIDYKLPFGGLIATVEGLFSQSINAIDYKDLNLGNPTTSVPGGDGRPIYPNNGLVGVVATNGGSARTSLNPAFTNIVYLGNTNQGYTYNFTAQIQRPFRNGISGSIAYNYGDAFSINDGTNSQAVSNWRFTPNREGVNNLSLTRSNFSAGHRLIIAATYRKEYANNKFATSVSLFYTRQSGAPYSITYINDFNREDLSNTTSNDLIYIPNSASEINFITNTRGTVTTADDLSPAQQWEILNNYIENNPYLRANRGRFAERNGARTPTTDQLDLRLMQEVFFDIKGRRQTLQLTFDVFNVLNALNKDWGFQYFVSNQNFSLINFAGFQSATGLPTFTINPPSNNEYLMPGRSNFGSRWQAQFGIRYIF